MSDRINGPRGEYSLKDSLRRAKVINMTGDCITDRAADRIEELEAALQSIAANTCCDTCQEAALVAKQALKGAEAETPERPSTGDQVPLQSSNLRTEVEKPHLERNPDPFAVLQADFQEHKRDTEQALQSLVTRLATVDIAADRMHRRIAALEQSKSTTSLDDALHSLNDLATNTPSRRERGSEDRTPDPQLGEVSTNGHVFRPWTGFHSTPDEARWQEDRRSGKERRVLKSGERPNGRYSVFGISSFPCRRKSARRKSDT